MRNLRYFGFFFLLPLVIGVPVSEDDSTEMNIKFAAGKGSYATITRGCEGQVLSKRKIPFQDMGFSVDYRIKSPACLGLRAGKIWTEYEYSVYTNGIEYEKMTNSYLNPNISLEGSKLGIGIGYFIPKKHLPKKEKKQLFSWHLRFGPPKSYFSIHYLENVPLYSGGGYVNLGLGGKAGKKINYWFGLGSAGPYDKAGFVAKTNFEIKRNWHLDLAGRLGGSEGIWENAIAVGLNYRL